MCLGRGVITAGTVRLGETTMEILRGDQPCPALVPSQCGQKRMKKLGLSSDDWGCL